MYGLAIVVMILTAATYNNNLIYLLAFSLFSILIVSMLQTHYNIRGVRLSVLQAADAFEGDHLNVLFQLEQARARDKRGLIIRSVDKSWPSANPVRETLLAQEPNKIVRGVIVAARRGVHQLPPFFVETTYPLGLFCAWKIFRPTSEVVVFPRPEGNRPLQAARHVEGEHDFGLRGSPEGDFGELKRYQVGESYHQIAWKHFAKRGVLYSKVHWGEDHKHYHIHWDRADADFEVYLRQLSAWIKLAVDEGATFALDLPDSQIGAGFGPTHAQTCWNALARLRESA